MSNIRLISTKNGLLLSIFSLRFPKSDRLLGAQILASVLGSKIYKNPIVEIGWYLIQATNYWKEHPLFEDINQPLSVFHWHGDTFDLPKGTTHLARSKACENQVFFQRNVIGLQIHLEMTVPGAKELISNGSDEMVDGPCTQNQETILKKTILATQMPECIFYCQN